MQMKQIPKLESRDYSEITFWVDKHVVSERSGWVQRITHGRQSGLEPFKTVQQTGLHPTAPAFIAWQKFSQVIKTGICEPIGTYTRKRHLQTVFVHARLRRQLSCLRRLSFDLSWILPGSLVSRVWGCGLLHLFPPLLLALQISVITT